MLYATVPWLLGAVSFKPPGVLAVPGKRPHPERPPPPLTEVSNLVKEVENKM